jgi:hypothetical protein
VWSYVYELRQGEEVIATGRLTRELPLEVGDQVELSDRVGLVRSIIPTLDPPEQRLVIQLRQPA